MSATRADWKNTPMPAAHKPLTLARSFSREEFNRIREGHIPQRMEDKWFVFFEDPWLHCHRSWTGECIWQVCFEQTGEGVRVTHILSNRDTTKYRVPDDATDAQWISHLLDWLTRNPPHP